MATEFFGGDFFGGEFFAASAAGNDGAGIAMGNYIGDFNLSTTLYTKFTMVNGSGLPTTLGDSPTFGFYQDANVTLFTAGVTVTSDFNSTTGLNHLQMTVTTSATGIVAGSSYQVVIATGSVSGVSVKGYPICEFSVLTRSPLRPAVAGRTLLVSSTGYAGIDWAAIGTPGSTVGLTATTLFTTTNVTNDVGAIVTAVNTIVPARVTAQGINIGAVVTAVNTIVPARVTAQGIDIGAIVTAVNTIVPARVTAQGIDVGAIVTAFNTIANANVTSMAANVLTASALATDAAEEISDTVWDEILSGHLGAGSTGEALNAAGAAGDPWVTALPGAYGAGSAGNIVGNNLDAAVSSRATVAGVWAQVISGSTTAIQAMRGYIAALLGKASGLEVNAPKYRDIADTKNVIDATTDTSGNRTNVNLDLS